MYRKLISNFVDTKKGSVYSQCQKYNVSHFINYTATLESKDLENITTEFSFTYCTDGWEYDVKQVSSSIIIDVILLLLSSSSVVSHCPSRR